MGKEGTCNKCGRFRKLTRGYCSSSCYSYLIRHNVIQRLPRKESPLKLTQEQEEILIGSLLGDGCLFCKKDKFPILSIGRKQEDIEYLEYEFEIFKDFCNQDVKNYEVFDKRTSKIYYGCKLVTRSSKALLKYYKKWYNKIKVLPKKLHLTPLICAIWFCDDGCITVHKRINRLRLKLSTHCFSKMENLRLSKILNKLFDEHFSLASNDGKYFITASDSGAKKFIKYIENFIPVSMSRKIKWTESHFKQKKSHGHIKNRNKLDFNEKEVKILKLLSIKKMSPKDIAIEMNWIAINKTAPSGLFLYLNRFLKYKWVIRIGILHSYKNGIKYELTKKGFNILTKYEKISINTDNHKSF